MDHDIWHFHLPMVGDTSCHATFFGLGVYLIVMGTLMTILLNDGQEEGR